MLLVSLFLLFCFFLFCSHVFYNICQKSKHLLFINLHVETFALYKKVIMWTVGCSGFINNEYSSLSYKLVCICLCFNINFARALWWEAKKAMNCRFYTILLINEHKHLSAIFLSGHISHTKALLRMNQKNGLTSQVLPFTRGWDLLVAFWDWFNKHLQNKV